MTTDQITCPTWCTANHRDEAAKDLAYRQAGGHALGASPDTLDTLHTSDSVVVEQAFTSGTDETLADVHIYMSRGVTENKGAAVVALNGEVYVQPARVWALGTALLEFARKLDLSTASSTTVPGPGTTDCPAWCTYTAGHDLDDGEPDRLHKGPSFGSFTVWSSTFNDSRPTILNVDTDNPDFDDPRALRLHALDALAAAEFMETIR